MNDFKAGDKVVCVNNGNGYDFCLTLYKTYTVIEVLNSFLKIADDNNEEDIFYRKYRFITLKEFRLLKLKQIYEQV